jgi:tetratricopeptide (TPR) repeat protein
MARRGKRKLSHDEQRNLDIEIGFLAGLTRRDPAYVEALQILGDDYIQRGRFGEGLKVDQQVARLRPLDPRALYNLACSYALNANHQAAFDELNRAIDAGYRDFRWLSRDPDLAAFRKHPLYRKLRVRVRTLRITVE